MIRFLLGASGLIVVGAVAPQLAALVLIALIMLGIIAFPLWRAKRALIGRQGGRR